MEIGTLTSDGKVLNARTVSQNKLLSECWMMQFNGLLQCADCEVKDTDECGGKNIRKTGKNEKGFSVSV